MDTIIFRTKYLSYEVTRDGLNKSFVTSDGENRLISGPMAIIVNNDGSKVKSIEATLDGKLLTILFSDGTALKLLVQETRNYITFTVTSISREDFLYVSFLNVYLSERIGDYEAVMMAMTAATRMQEHPGDNRSLVASAYPHIGITSTKRSKNPAKAAIFAAPKKLVREIERDILNEIPNGEIPKSKLGGPYADCAESIARGDYFILMHDTATLENVDEIIAEMRRFGLTQITLHHNSHYRQGDFLPCTAKFPNGAPDFKSVVDRFHQNGIKVGLQTYSFFLSKSSKYLAPVPHKDLDVLKSFTLAEDVCADSLSLSVIEDTDGISAKEGFIYVNSPYLWIDDELIKFSLAENGVFTVAERGALGTHPASHKSGSAVKQLKQYFLLPLARAGSELFYEIAKNTAEFFKESGADYFYLDALDGAFVLDGDEYVWYHAMDFVKEMFAHLRRDIIFDCCYNPQYTGTWYVRSRYGAIDVSLNAHRAYFDAHVEYNERTAKRMGITPELGWIDLFPREDDPEKWWLNEPMYPEDIEFAAAKAYATEASLAFLEGFRRHGALPSADSYSKILREYSFLRSNKKPSEKTKQFLLKDNNGAKLKDGVLYESGACTVTFEQGYTKSKIVNSFKKQIPTFRLAPLHAADTYDNPNAVTLLSLDESNPITEPIRARLKTPVKAKGNHGLGVWCYGDGSGALVTVTLRNVALNSGKASEHYIKADFVGWKYFAFYETQNATRNDVAKRRLEYNNYNHLQEFYGYYRAKLDYEALDGVDITVFGSTNIRLRDLRLLPTVAPEIVNPTLHFGDSSIKIFTRLRPNTTLYFDGKECIVTDLVGNQLSHPSFIGYPEICEGECEIRLDGEENAHLSRAKLTVITVGDILE